MSVGVSLRSSPSARHARDFFAVHAASHAASAPQSLPSANGSTAAVSSTAGGFGIASAWTRFDVDGSSFLHAARTTRSRHRLRTAGRR